MPPETVSFRLPAITAGLSDAELLPRIGWRRSASDRLPRAARDGDLQVFGAALHKHAARLLKPGRSEHRSGVCNPLLQPLWSLRAFDGTHDLADLMKRVAEQPEKPSRRAVDRMSRRILETLDTGSAQAVSPFTRLNWLALLVWGSGSINDETLSRLWLCALRETLRQPSHGDAGVDPSLTDDQRVLVQGELPFVAGLVFQDVRGSRRLVRHGTQVLRDELRAGTDSDGTPHSQLLDRFSLWLSPFCRAAIVGRGLGRPWWNRRSAARFSNLVLRSAALTRSSGEFALGNGVALAPAALLKAAASVAEPDGRQPSTSFVEAVPNDVALLTRRKVKSARLPKRIRSARAGNRVGSCRDKRSHRPALQSDWAQLACLRNNWDLGADACVIAWNEPQPRIDLTALGCAVLNGAWKLESFIDDVPVGADADWECVCWFSDRDVDYIELQRQSDGASVLRQVALSRTDHFLYLADTLSSGSDTARSVEHAFELPLVGAPLPTRDALTREWLLEIGSLKVRVLPLSLEQDATCPSAGDLTVRGDAVRLQQKSAGPALTASLVMDWSPARRREAAVWNRLTIAEDGRILNPCEAGGTHLRLGAHQWLFYRSLVPGQTVRTVLGQHTPHEAIIGEMNSSGDLDPLVIVEG